MALERISKQEKAMPLIKEERALQAIPDTDCGGRLFSANEKEDIKRYILDGAEIQRDKDFFDYLPAIERAAMERVIERLEINELVPAKHFKITAYLARGKEDYCPDTCKLCIWQALKSELLGGGD